MVIGSVALPDILALDGSAIPLTLSIVAVVAAIAAWSLPAWADAFGVERIRNVVD